MATSLFSYATTTIDNHVETSKQITKALKCVAFTNMQVNDMMLRKHERLEKRIAAVNDEIALLRTDVVENVATQRERRQQLTDIADDIEKAHVLGNAPMVAELLDELTVLQAEGKREDALCRSLQRALRSRRRVRCAFIVEKRSIEDDMRAFARKQTLIHALLSTFARDSSMDTARDANDDDADDAASTMTDFDESEFLCDDKKMPLKCIVPDNSAHATTLYPDTRKNAPPLRPRRWSADERTAPPRKPRFKRRALSAHSGVRSSLSSSRPHSLGSVEEEEENANDTEDTEDTVDANEPQVLHPIASRSIELEEIHDEQDNYYTHTLANDASDASSDNDTNDSDHECERCAPLLFHSPSRDRVVISACVQSVLVSEMHTLKLKLRDDVVAAVASVRTALPATPSPSDASFVDTLDAPPATTVTLLPACDQVEAARIASKPRSDKQCSSIDAAPSLSNSK